MKVVVTGASGFIGGAIVRKIAKDNRKEIIAIGRSDCKRFSEFSNVQYLRQDLSKETSDLSCDICIHCAGLANDYSSESEYYTHNVLATRLLVNRLVDSSVLVFISSASVYSFKNGEMFTENDVQLTDSLFAYGRSKLLAEKEIEASHIRTRYILRPRAVYGVGDKKIIPRILGLVKGNYLVLPKNIQSQTSLTHINNLVEAVLATIQNNKKGCHVFNICDREKYDLQSVITAIIDRHLDSNVKHVGVSNGVVLGYLKLVELFKIKSVITLQSYEYIKHDSVMDNSKAIKELSLDLRYNFHMYLHQLEDSTGLD